MTQQQILDAIFAALSAVAPEVEPSDIRPDRKFRDQVDLDSMDFMNFLVGIHERLKVEIAATDVQHFETLDSMVAWLSGKLGGG